MNKTGWFTKLMASWLAALLALLSPIGGLGTAWAQAQAASQGAALSAAVSVPISAPFAGLGFQPAFQGPLLGQPSGALPLASVRLPAAGALPTAPSAAIPSILAQPLAPAALPEAQPSSFNSAIGQEPGAAVRDWSAVGEQDSGSLWGRLTYAFDRAGIRSGALPDASDSVLTTPSGASRAVLDRSSGAQPSAEALPSVTAPSKTSFERRGLRSGRSWFSRASGNVVRAAVLALAGLIAFPGTASAQYFGQNRTQYHEHDTKVMETPHYNVHFDAPLEPAARVAAKAAEKWYEQHSKAFQHQFIHRKGKDKGKPYKLVIVPYGSDAKFWETNIFGPGQMPEGVLGVTEPFQNRMAFPFQADMATTLHTEGHEQVHQFQFDILGPQAMGRLPLWFVEGMAEYYSTGKIDVQTAMWLREAALNGFLPSIEELSYVGDIRVYRMGQSIWQFIAEKYGEEKAREIMKAVAGVENSDVVGVARRAAGMPVDLDTAFQRAIGRSLNQLSKEWTVALQRMELPKVAQHKMPWEIATPLAGPDHDGSFINMAPTVSPDGKRVAFMTFRGLALGVYVGNIEEMSQVERAGVIKPTPKKLADSEVSDKLDSIRILNASQSWSPDGKKIAFGSYTKGQAAISIIELQFKANKDAGKVTEAPSPGYGYAGAQTQKAQEKLDKKTLKQIKIPEVDDINNTSWSPDGKQIVFTGLKNGFSNIYVVNADGTGLKQLTDDQFSDLHPAWSPDGSRIAFATDRGPDTDYAELKMGPRRIAVLDLKSGEVSFLPGQVDNNINPQWSPDGKQLAFASDRSGIHNVYMYDFEKGQTTQVTDVLSGVTGITEASPSFVWAKASQGDFLVLTVFEKGGLALYKLDDPRSQAKPWAPAAAAAPQGGGATVELLEGPAETAATAAATAQGGTAPRQVGEQPIRPDVGVKPYEGVVIWKPAEFAAAPAPQTPEAETPPASGDFVVKPYQPKLKFDFSMRSPVGWASNSGFFANSVFRYSDVMGNRELFGILSGRSSSIEGTNIIVGFNNYKKKTDWGITGFQVGRPNIFSFEGPLGPEIGSRVFRGVDFTASRPFSRFTRIEGSIQGVQMTDRQIDGFDYYGRVRQHTVGRAYYTLPRIAFVFDNAVPGNYSYAKGTKLRAEYGKSIGGLSYNIGNVDARKYFGNRDFQIAMRAVGTTLSGRDPQYLALGGAWTVHGYPYGTIIGDKMAMGNVEVRFPFIELLFVRFPIPMLTQLRGALFADGAYTSSSRLSQDQRQLFRDNGYYTNQFVGSYGFALRGPILGIPMEIARVWRYNDNPALRQYKEYNKKWTFSIAFPF